MNRNFWAATCQIAKASAGLSTPTPPPMRFPRTCHRGAGYSLPSLPQECACKLSLVEDVFEVNGKATYSFGFQQAFVEFLEEHKLATFVKVLLYDFNFWFYDPILLNTVRGIVNELFVSVIFLRGGRQDFNDDQMLFPAPDFVGAFLHLN